MSRSTIISRTRRRMYRGASLLGDIDAIASGSPRRIIRRAYNKTWWKLCARLFTLGMWKPR